jgi:sarcosine oxidase gamma subunit
MGELMRQPPVTFPSQPLKSEIRQHWRVVIAYRDEGPGPWLVDLSHKARWDLQDNRLDELTIQGLTVPKTPGRCRLENRILVSRLTPTQAAVWHLGNPDAPELPGQEGYTDISEAGVLLSLLGPKVFSIMEKLTALDLLLPNRKIPFLLQGPFAQVPCQIVTLAREKRGVGALLLTCARGYARDMTHAIMAAGAEFGLRPAGESAFIRYLEDLNDGSGGGAPCARPPPGWIEKQLWARSRLPCCRRR